MDSAERFISHIFGSEFCGLYGNGFQFLTSAECLFTDGLHAGGNGNLTQGCTFAESI